MRTPVAPAVLIDASNICRDPRVRPVGATAAWERLEQLTHALEQSSIEFSQMYVVADTSLKHKLAERGRQRLRALERDGRAEQRKFADERLLELAFSPQSALFGAIIVTCDYFDDFRRRYPDLDSASAIGWETDEEGNISVALRDFGARTHLRVSRKEEEAELVERRLRRHEVQQRAAAYYFRCVNRRCLAAQLWPDHLEELPSYDERSDDFVCPSCGDLLELGDVRLPAVQVIAYLDGIETFRILVEDGSDLSLGRSDAKGQIGLDRHLPKQRVSAISRRHLVLSLRGDDLWVTDVGSKNGTFLGRRRSQPADQRPLRAGEATRWLLRDVILLPEGITLERSGRRLPLVGERADDRVDPDAHSGRCKWTVDNAGGRT